MGKLRARRRLADTIDADDEEYEGLVGGQRERWGRIRWQPFGHFGARDFDHIIRRDLAAERLKLVDDFHGESRAEIGRDQFGFNLVPVDFRLVGDLIIE